MNHIWKNQDKRYVALPDDASKEEDNANKGVESSSPMASATVLGSPTGRAELDNVGSYERGWRESKTSLEFSGNMEPALYRTEENGRLVQIRFL